MPRSGTGTYTLPSGNPVVTGTTIEANWANSTLSDVASTLTDSLSRSGQGGMTAALRIADGTQSAPGVGFANETQSGFYRAGTGEVWAVVQGAQTLNLDASGVTVPAAKATSIEGTFVFNETGADKDARFEGDTDANLLFIDASTDRVGVGTDTPTAKLNVEGSVIINDAGADVDVRIEGDTDANLLFVDASTDRVGVGTNAPGDKLEVNGRVTAKSASDNNLAFVLNNTASGGREWQFIASATGGLDGGGTFNIRDNTAAANRITLNSSGQVGIGITPTAALDVNGTVKATTFEGNLSSTILAQIYPVGSIYINATNATNPGTLMGFGTWVAFGAGRVPVGFNASNPLFDTAEETGGSADAIVVSHTHTATSSVTDPGHTHTATVYDAGSSASFAKGNATTGGNTGTTNSSATGISVSTSIASTGSSGTNANYQPYITVYMWKRTA